jgi:Zn-dependent protease
MVSAAGILANLLIATCAFVILKVMLMTGGFAAVPESLREPVLLFLRFFLTMNVSLAIFNLLPFPPLDGSKILETFLPASARPMLEMLEQFGFVILMVLIYVGFFSAIISPVMRFIYYLLLL